MPQTNTHRPWPPAAPDTPRRHAPAIPGSGSPLTNRIKLFQDSGPAPVPNTTDKNKNPTRVIMTRQQSAKARSKEPPLGPETSPVTKQKALSAVKAETRPLESNHEDTDTSETETETETEDEEGEDDDAEDDEDGARVEEIKRYQDKEQSPGRTARHTSENSDLTDQDLYDRFAQPMVLSQSRRRDHQPTTTQSLTRAIETRTSTNLHASSSSHPNRERYREGNHNLAGLYDRLQTVHSDQRQQKPRDPAGYTIGDLERHTGKNKSKHGQPHVSEKGELSLKYASNNRGIYSYIPRNWATCVALLLFIAAVIFMIYRYNNHFGWDTLSQVLFDPSFPRRLWRPVSQPKRWWSGTLRWVKRLDLRRLWRKKTAWEKFKDGEFRELAKDLKRMFSRKKGWWWG